MHKNFIKKLLSSKTFLFFIILILIALIISFGKESYRKYQLTKEINRLQSEIERLEGRNQQLANLMDYFKEESYLEKEARIKLNLKKPGEKVVILSDYLGIENPSGDIKENAETIIVESISPANYWKWWEYFFGQ